MNILVTGGAGYIGAHTLLELAKSKHNTIVIDDLSAGSKSNVPDNLQLYEGDFANFKLLSKIFTQHRIDAVFHLAASIEVGESFNHPGKYLENNVTKTAQLLNAMESFGVNQLVFASSAGVYGNQDIVPISEDAETRPVNPYGESKLLAEQIIDYHCRYSGLKAVALRFFNVCGSSTEVNINQKNKSSLFSQIAMSIKDNQPFTMYGNDYLTPDGTCIRDYVNVQDIAHAYLLALDSLDTQVYPFEAYNVGTGKGLSIKEIVNAFEQESGKKLNINIEPSNAGTVPVSIADISKIASSLNFVPSYSDLNTLVKSSLQK